jgi:hypothetical protein
MPTHSIPRKAIQPLEVRWGFCFLGIAWLASFLWVPATAAQNDWAFRPPTSTGPAVGEKIPAFRAPDQNGRMQDFNSIKGPKGAALYFMRSADW